MMSQQLSEEDKEKLRALYRKSRDETLAHDLKYLVNMKPTALAGLLESRDNEVQLLGQYALLIQQYLADFLSGGTALPNRAVSAFTAALLYIVNPFDLVPDRSPGGGYADDWFVLELALAEYPDTLSTFAAGKQISMPRHRP